MTMHAEQEIAIRIYQYGEEGKQIENKETRRKRGNRWGCLYLGRLAGQHRMLSDDLPDKSLPTLH